MDKELIFVSAMALLLSTASCSAPTIDREVDKTQTGRRTPAEKFQDSADPFIAIQTQYFPMLDLRTGTGNLSVVSQFAARLSQIADGERAKLSSNKLETVDARHRAGLIFIYDGLMTTNNTNAVLNGILKLSDLTVKRSFADKGAPDHEELIARARYTISSLELAARLRPDDRRIDSWLAAAQINLDKISNGGISDQSLKHALDAITIRPTFNLFTAIILFHGHSENSPMFTQLAQEAKKFVDATSSGSDPCANHPEDCGSGSKSPFNLQASVTMLGDVFSREAEHLLRSGNIPGAMQMVGYAKGTYAHLQADAQVDATNKWSDSAVLSQRITYLETLKPGATPEISAFTSLSGYNRVYECSSCHGRASSQFSAQLKISEWAKIR